MFRIQRKACVVLLLLSCFPLSALADDVALRGRKILQDHKEAVVTVLLVLRQHMSFPGMPSRSSESKSEATGTVIDATGLTIVSLSQTDPSSLVEAIMGRQGTTGLKMETEVTDVKILLGDDTEIPAEVILRDKDLDMAFIRPLKKPDTDFVFIDLHAAVEPQILDQVISLNRLGKVAGRVHSVAVERVEAVVRRPRTFYIPGNDPTNTGLGSPAFDLDGNVIGVFLMRTIRTEGGSSIFGGSGNSMSTVILPALEILDAAEQAPPFED